MKNHSNNPRHTRNLSWLLGVLLTITCLLPWANAQEAPPPATVTTDQADYPPGSTAYISGSGFWPGETVVLQVLHADGTPSTGLEHEPWSVVADDTGGFQTSWYVCEDDCLGATLELTAVGLSSGLSAKATFTDAAPQIKVYEDAARTVERTIFKRGETVYARATDLDSTKSYKIELKDKSGTQKSITACTTGVTQLDASYTILSDDPLSDSAEWTYLLREWPNSSCSGGMSGGFPKERKFDVCELVAYADAALTTPQTTFCPGATVYIVVSGLNPSSSNWKATWILPGGTTACSNTSGGDRPDSDGNGRLPDAAGSFLQYPPGASGAAWNLSANYDSGNACEALTCANKGGWKLKLDNSGAQFITLDAFVLDETPPVVTVPAAALTMECFDAAAVAAWAATASALDNCDGSVAVTPSYTAPADNCDRTVTVTFSATDACGNVGTASKTFTVDDSTPPELTCPDDVIIFCGDSLDPDVNPNLGSATATDNCDSSPTITYSDSSTGTCPKVITRTWTAEDDCGNTSTCDQTITLIAPSLVTSSSLCNFDFGGCVDDAFRLIFHQRPDAPSLWKLTSSNPGQFYYSVFVSGGAGDAVDLAIKIPYPFVTQGAQPIHVYGAYSLDEGGAGYCLQPNSDVTSSYTITTSGTSVSPSGAEIIVLGDYASQTDVETVTVTGSIPASGTLLVTIHLDYGLKGTKDWQQTTSPVGSVVGTASPITGVTLVPCQPYTFSFGPTIGPPTDMQIVRSVYEFKKNAGFGVSICTNPDLGSEPLAGVKFVVWDAKGTTKIGEAVTDVDGAGFISYKHKAKAADYWIKVPAYNKATKLTIKANGFGFAEYIVP